MAVVTLLAGLLCAACARDAEPDAELFDTAAAGSSAAPAEAGEEESSEPPERIAIRVLVVAHEGVDGSDATRSEAEALERARMLGRMARAGDPMKKLVAEYGDRTDAKAPGGMFKIRTASPEPFDAEVVEAALALEPGEVSSPVETPVGYLVLERHPDPPPGPERIAARHILIAHEGSARQMGEIQRTEAEARALAERVAEQARASDADWDALAAQHTDEPGGAERGGDLGTFERGSMVPAFERAAFGLEVGEVSDVVQTPFGFHVITRYQ